MKKMMLISLIILILVTSCKDDTTSPVIKPLNTDELIPLKIGNNWVYDKSSYNGSIQMRVPGNTTVDSEIQYQSEKHFLLKDIDHLGDTTIEQVYHINKADGYYMIFLDVDEDTLIIKFNYPTFAGDIMFENEVGKFYVDKVDVIYSTPAGKFECIKYVQIVYQDGKELLKCINYIAPGIGRVAFEIYGTTPQSDKTHLVEKSMLKSYELK